MTKVKKVINLQSGVEATKPRDESFDSIQNGVPIYADNLLEAYTRQIEPKDFLKICQKKYAGGDMHKMTSMEGLMYISSLSENNKSDEAKQMLVDYVKVYGTKDIFRFPRTVDIATEIKISDKNIEKAKVVYAHLQKNRDEKLLDKMIEGKSVAIVGSAPFEKGKGNGPTIDSYDISIRFNNYVLNDEHKIDYGSKTDIFARNTINDDVKDRPNDNYDLTILQGDFKRGPLMFEVKDGKQIEHLDSWHRDILAGKNYYSIAPETTKSLKQASGIYHSTAGLAVFWDILRSKKGQTNDIAVYGLGLSKEASDKFADHYYETRSAEDRAKYSKGHDFGKEAGFIGMVIEDAEKVKKYFNQITSPLAVSIVKEGR